MSIEDFIKANSDDATLTCGTRYAFWSTLDSGWVVIARRVPGKQSEFQNPYSGPDLQAALAALIGD